MPYLPTVRFAGIGRMLIKLVPHEGVQLLSQLSEIFWARASAIYKEKKYALERGDAAVSQQVGGGKDIMSILRAYWAGLEAFIH